MGQVLKLQGNGGRGTEGNIGLLLSCVANTFMEQLAVTWLHERGFLSYVESSRVFFPKTLPHVPMKENLILYLRTNNII